MEIVTKLKAIDLSRSRFIVSALIFINAFAVESLVAQQRPHSCKAAKIKIDRKVIEADVEKYRRGESPTIESAYELINCTEAFPLLKKYALDPDPKVRELITDYVGRYSSPERLQLLVQQIETYPLKNAAMRYAYRYPCRSFSQIKKTSLAAALISRIKEDQEDVHGNEIYILGCLAGRDMQARKFLGEMRLPSFQTRLDGRPRRYQLLGANFALAEANDPAAVAAALSEIEAIAAQGTANDVDILIRESVRRTNNCVLLNRFASFINDKREGPTVYLGDGVKTLQLRYGDIAVLAFTNRFGTRVTGYEYKDDESQRHTDADLEEIYGSVKKYLDKQCGQNSIISSTSAAK